MALSSSPDPTVQPNPRTDVDVSSVADSFARLSLGPSSANRRWVIGNVLQPVLDTTHECKFITENHDCFKPARRLRERWDIKAEPWDNFVRLLCGCLHFPFVLLQNPSNAHTQSFEQMRQCYTIDWVSTMLDRIGLSLDEVSVLDICALFSDEDLQKMDAERRSCAVEDAYLLVEEMLMILRPILIISCQCMTQGTWKSDGQEAWKRAGNDLARQLCSSIREARAHRAVAVDRGDLRIWIVRGFHPRRLHYEPSFSPVLTKLFHDVYDPCERWRRGRMTADSGKLVNAEQVNSQTRSPFPTPLAAKHPIHQPANKDEDIEEQEFEARLYAARPSNPNYHYVPELGGWYDSDEECEECNRADDLMRMIEGDWD